MINSCGSIGILALFLVCSSPQKANAIPVADTSTANILENADGTLAMQMAAHDTDNGGEFSSAVYSDVWTPSSGTPTLTLNYNFAGLWSNANVASLRALIVHEFRQDAKQLYRSGFLISAENGSPNAPYGSAGTFDVFDPANETLSFGEMNLPYSCGTDGTCAMNAYVDSVSGWRVIDNVEAPDPLVPLTFVYDPAGLSITETWTISVSAQSKSGNPAWVDFANTVDVGYVATGGSFTTTQGRSFGAAAIPEPSTLILTALGLAGLAFRRKQRDGNQREDTEAGRT